MENLKAQLKDLEHTVDELRGEHLKLDDKRKSLDNQLTEVKKVNADYEKAMNRDILMSLKEQAEALQQKNEALQQGIDKDFETWKVLEAEGIDMAKDYKRKQEERSDKLDKITEDHEGFLARFDILTPISPLANLRAYVDFLSDIESDNEIPLDLNRIKVHEVCAEGILDSLIALKKRTKDLIECTMETNKERYEALPELVGGLKRCFAQLETSI